MGDTSEKILNKLDNIQKDLNSVKNQQEENTKILRALEHKADVHKAETDNLTHEIAEIKGTQKTIKDNIESIKYDVNVLSINTAKNSLDIARMKDIK